MKSKRKFSVAIIFLVIVIGISLFLLQNHTINTDRYIPQSSKTLVTEWETVSDPFSPSIEAAIELIKQKGYTATFISNGWETSKQLSVLIGTCIGAEGYCKKAFFFYNGEYLGTDASDPSAQIGVVWQDDNTVALNYVLYRKEDAMCCPTAGGATVRFQWDGSKLVALDPIPSANDVENSRR